MACYIHQIPDAIEMIHETMERGYEVCANVMAVSTVAENEIANGIRLLAETGVHAVYLVDSFGSLHSHQSHHLAEM